MFLQDCSGFQFVDHWARPSVARKTVPVPDIFTDRSAAGIQRDCPWARVICSPDRSVSLTSPSTVSRTWSSVGDVAFLTVECQAGELELGCGGEVDELPVRSRGAGHDAHVVGGEVQHCHEFGNTNVFVCQAAPEDVVGVRHDLHAGVGQVGVEVSCRKIECLPWRQADSVEK